MRGRRPKPDAMKRAAGNPGRRPLNDNAPQFAVPERAPYAPRHLSAEAQREWRRVADLLTRARVLTEADLAALELYCVAWARWTKANLELATQDWVLTGDKGGQYQTPWLGIASKAFEQMMKCLVEFGMTPSSRTRVQAAGTPREKSLVEMLFEGATGQDVEIGDDDDEGAPVESGQNVASAEDADNVTASVV